VGRWATVSLPRQDQHAHPHRHLDLPLQAPAAEAEGSAVGGTCRHTFRHDAQDYLPSSDTVAAKGIDAARAINLTFDLLSANSP
jgi:hypothetical protein